MTHRLHLFDTADSLASTVAAFCSEGYQAGGNLLIVAKPANRAAILGALKKTGCFLEDNNGRQRVVALDAREIFERISRNGSVDPRLFEAVVVPVVERLSASGNLWVYGEIVELLAEQDDFNGAIRLEKLWNSLAGRYPFTLLCGYSSAHFAATGSRAALRDICEAHTHFTAANDDTLGRWLLTSTGTQTGNYV